LGEHISQVGETRKAAADGLVIIEAEVKEAARLVRELRAELASAREGKARVEVRLETARSRRAEASRRIRETLDCLPDECLAVAGIAETTALPSLQETARSLQRLREDRERLGGVNLAAEDELGVLEEQLASLESDRTDLEGAIAQLRQGIAKLTREGRKRLAEAFTKVDVHFQQLFTTLFGGGEARLEMIEDPEDLLAGGLEIVARPPGKKPATLSLLSGGEQTLTALSLIFAVFLANPAPICVLDEVDAPLDDANVDRFCTLMEEMARTTATRFLVITHHPLTMSRMDRLFGVTMVEKGVSQLVSVDLAAAVELREAV
jgi:chromosome segregation protein